MKKPAVFPLYLSLLWLGWSTIIPVMSCPDNGLYYQETLNDGSVRHVIEKNVVVLNQKLKAIPADADEKMIEKLSRENKKIEQANQSRLNSVKEFEKFFNGYSINGAKNSLGESVLFKFNIIEENVENTACIQTSRILSRKYALPSALTTQNGNKVMVYAAILTTVSANGEMGKAQGNIIYQVSAKAPEGTLSHELGHALYLLDSYGFASSEFGDGLMGAEPKPITPQEVDQIIAKCLKRDK
ncbi:MAG: hypothetical protein SFV55_15475 [Haliscomenobacter sp.]|uniref:hypothetical protein n=1 Tax=Haliscomenobacter sp. TaxID=2717303 RepID=UPI0029AAEEC8|nr:hypothetical protein [Haliscomenobacter sp.]MDX2069828.1 hypothetical protein [Haliscomenobacter sp.]